LQNKVKKYLEEHGLKKSYLAAYIGVHQSQLSSWLSGNLRFKQSQIEKIQRFLDGEWK